jgi:hypothetical protein
MARGLIPGECRGDLPRDPFAVGFVVTLVHIRRRRSSRMITMP